MLVGYSLLHQEREVGLIPMLQGRGIGIFLCDKYARLVKAYGALYANKVIWINLESIAWGNVGMTCVYALTFHQEEDIYGILCKICSLKIALGLLGGNFIMIDWPNDKYNNYGRAMSDLERFSSNGLMNGLQIQDIFVFQRGVVFLRPTCHMMGKEVSKTIYVLHG